MAPLVRLACIATLALAGTAGAAHHESAEHGPGWDQEAAARLAAELAESVKGIRKAVRQAGAPSMGSMQARKFHQFTDKLRVIESESKHLAGALADGEGREQTRPAYDRLQLLVRDARELARSLFIQQSIQDRIDVARAKLDALAAYYPAD
jgi:hypothetical protein